MTQPLHTRHCPEVAVIIPTHNRRDVLLRCLGHVYAAEGVSFRVVIVFDGCTDGSQEAVRGCFPDSVMVEGDGTLWWSGSINAGIGAAQRLGVRYFCLLNDDVQPDPEMLAALVRMAERHPGALIGSKVYYLQEPRRLWSAGGHTDWYRSGTYMRGGGQWDGSEWSCPAAVDWFPGMGTLVPASVVSQIGPMDAERFPQYFGDTDFSLRARRASVPLVLCPEAKLYNDVTSTGDLLPAGAIEWNTAVRVLCSLRSHANFRTRWHFWLRHCPPFLIPWQVLRFYAPLLGVITKKLIWDRRSLLFRRANEPHA